MITIVIPCKNEEGYMNRLLSTLHRQTVKPAIIIADGGSTDKTLEEISWWRERLNINVIQGGNVSRGRNNGARLVRTPYVLFIDGDMLISKANTLEKLIEKLKTDKFDLVTAHIRCHNSKRGDFVYHLNNIGQRVSKLIHTPFSTGAFMCVRKSKFDEIGGFDESIHFAEDYWLSKQIKAKRFGILNVNVYTSNRRFLKSGHTYMVTSFLKTFFNRNNHSHFAKDINYWK